MQRQRGAAFGDEEGAAIDRDPALQEVHRRRADETGDEEVGWAVVEFQRCPDLLDLAVMKHDDPVGHGHGLDLVMGDIDRVVPSRWCNCLISVRIVPAVWRRGWTAARRSGRAADCGDRAGEGHALALAAGKLARQASEQRAEAEDTGGPLSRPDPSWEPFSFRGKAMFSATLICG